MPPTLGADIASFIVPRLKRPIFLPEISANDIATVTTPIPPIWIKIKIITCPKIVQCVAVSKTTNPVTHTADVDVNKESIKEVHSPDLLDIGRQSKNAPIKITAAKPSKII